MFQLERNDGWRASSIWSGGVSSPLTGIEHIIQVLCAKCFGEVHTRRETEAGLCEWADLVSEMREIKHPFHAGIKAQTGIDF